MEVSKKSVPVSVVAKIFGKDPCWVRAGLIEGWLPIGTATRRGRKVTDISQMDSRLGRINYYVSPKLLYEMTGSREIYNQYYGENNQVIE